MPISKAQSENIEFGRVLLRQDLEAYWIRLLHVIQSNGEWKCLATDTHPLGIIMWYLREAWPRMTAGTGKYDQTGSGIQAEQIFMNLGRLMREEYRDDTQLYFIKKMPTELRKTHDGQANADAALASLVTALQNMWFLVGGDMKDLFGTWDRTKYLRQDDAFAGWIACAEIVVTWVNVHDISYMKRERSMAEYSVENGVVKGHYRELRVDDPATYGALMSSLDNEGDEANSNTAKDYLGVSAEYVDEPMTKGFDVMVFDAAEGLANKLLGESEFTWKFNRNIKVIPEFMLYNPSSETEKGLTLDDMKNTSIDARPMANGTKIYHRTIRRLIIEMISDFKTYFFKNDAFAKHKTRFKLMNIYDLPMPGVGNAGLMSFQSTHIYDISAIASDKIRRKWWLDTTDNGIRRISMRRSTHHNNRYQLIGDVEISDLLLFLGMCMEDVYIDGAKETLALNQFFRPVGGMVMAMYKKEDDPWKVSRKLYSLIGGATYKSHFYNRKDESDSSYDYNNSNRPSTWAVPSGWVYPGTNELNYPESIVNNKALFYYGRAADPYKKLTHRVIDTNELDFTEIANTLRQAFGFTSTKQNFEIPVSAVPEKEEDDVFKKEETPVSALPEEKEEEKEQPVSAVPDAEKKVTKLNKDLTAAKKDLAVEKKKEAKKDGKP